TISSNLYKKPVMTTGASAGWVGETDARSQSTTPTLDELSFPAMELYAMPAATAIMLEDAAVMLLVVCRLIVVNGFASAHAEGQIQQIATVTSGQYPSPSQ